MGREIWAVIELGFLAALQAVIGGFDSHTVHQYIYIIYIGEKFTREGPGHRRGLISLCNPWFKSKSRIQIGSLTQLVECCVYIANVGGSSPSGFTRYF